MITDFDDYPVHQAPEPVARPASTDKNFYDRYWFNGFDRSGTLYLGAALGVYPNRKVMDGAFTFVVDGVQHSVHASRVAAAERKESRVGPVAVEVAEPMRTVRVAVSPNETGIEADLTFRARTIPYEEPRSRLVQDGKVILDTCRFTQLGTWQGTVTVEGRRYELAPSEVLAARDRSWGVRPIGPREPEPPPEGEPGVYWIWSVDHFADRCLHYGSFEDHDGHPIQSSGAFLPAYEPGSAIPRGADPGVREMARSTMRLEWSKGTRYPSKAALELVDRAGETHLVTMEPLLRAHMKGLGYQHPEWGHGFWKGDGVVFGERWRLDELDPLIIPNVHVQQVCRVTLGEREGVGTLESVVIGTHRPSGFTSLLDGAA